MQPQLERLRCKGRCLSSHLLGDSLAGAITTPIPLTCGDVGLLAVGELPSNLVHPLELKPRRGMGSFFGC